ncbi:biofilm regulation diguanylate cyclase SiaD [Paraburkholderia sp. ZP32-5]|uniref:biofilm regulation diguanylate cyclase SiaD n=1 Tax=Paraburkholderia sp. ZP32-5 TaxID=2883245 RepID=UPI001F1F8B25|nr:biofilm regulation diguanylate cyclase SiaD [Paraburkholderia sp. ZP32-5]
MSGERELDTLVEQLLADPQYLDHPLRKALFLVYQHSTDQLNHLERITRISDGFQSMTRAQHSTLSERYDQQLRRLRKILRISDRYQAMMTDLNDALKTASTHDPLTGIGNRRLITERLQEESARAQRSGKPYSLVLLDADNFKRINDTWGHNVGDRVLVEISRAMKGVTRQSDLCGRWGGEEFLLLLPETSLDNARIVVEHIHKAVCTVSIRVGAEMLSVTASFGATEYLIGEDYMQTIGRADAALFEAKREGRNRCVFVKGG